MLFRSILSDEYDALLYRLRPKYVIKAGRGLDKETALILLGEEIWKELGKKYGVILEFEKR